MPSPREVSELAWPAPVFLQESDVIATLREQNIDLLKVDPFAHGGGRVRAIIVGDNEIDGNPYTPTQLTVRRLVELPSPQPTAMTPDLQAKYAAQYDEAEPRPVEPKAVFIGIGKVVKRHPDLRRNKLFWKALDNARRGRKLTRAEWQLLMLAIPQEERQFRRRQRWMARRQQRQQMRRQLRPVYRQIAYIMTTPAFILEDVKIDLSWLFEQRAWQPYLQPPQPARRTRPALLQVGATRPSRRFKKEPLTDNLLGDDGK